MDSSFSIKPPAGVRKLYAPRDPVPVPEAVETDLGTVKAVAATGDSGDQQRQPPPRHTPHEMVTDPDSREVINREADVRAHADDRPHPDQALLRQRAYGALRGETELPQPVAPKAVIEA